MAEAKTTTKTAESTGPAKAETTTAYEAPKQKVKTIDSAEPDIGWTAQSSSRPDGVADRNPVTLSKDELPDPDEAAAQGVDVETYMANFTNVEE